MKKTARHIATLQALFMLASTVHAQQAPSRPPLDSAWLSLASATLSIPQATDATPMEDSLPDMYSVILPDPELDASKAADSLLTLSGDYLAFYRYEDATLALQNALEICVDSIQRLEIGRELDNCRAAAKLSRSAAKVKTLWSGEYSADEFFLYYPFEEGVWRSAEGIQAVYCEGEADRISVDPTRIFEVPQGDKLYFSSKELGGFGGYDIFVCKRDSLTGELGEPQNLGLPYNSSADDMLYLETPDGKYTFFASNRFVESLDSVRVYVLKQDPSPVREKLFTSEQILGCTRLVPAGPQEGIVLTRKNPGPEIRVFYGYQE